MKLERDISSSVDEVLGCVMCRIRPLSVGLVQDRTKS